MHAPLVRGPQLAGCRAGAEQRSDGAGRLLRSGDRIDSAYTKMPAAAVRFRFGGSMGVLPQAGNAPAHPDV